MCTLFLSVSCYPRSEPSSNKKNTKKKKISQQIFLHVFIPYNNQLNAILFTKTLKLCINNCQLKQATRKCNVFYINK